MFNREKGITLVALIVTIIILVILVAVTVKIAFDSKMIGFSSKSIENYAKLQETEKKELDETATMIEEVVSKIEDVNPEEEEKQDVVETETEFRIYTKLGMEIFRDRVNDGETFEEKTVYLMKDIDLKGNDSDIWEPIGNEDEGVIFKGTFEGNYYTISNLYYRGESRRTVGLFSSNYGTIQNLVLENVDIYNTYSNTSKHTYTGGIAGQLNGIITNCGINSGEITGENLGANSYYGALVGGITGNFEEGEVSNCYNKTSIKSICKLSNTSQAVAGGIIGASNATKQDSLVQNCYNVGKIEGTGLQIFLAGILGNASRNSNRNYTIENLYNVGILENNGGSMIYIAGIIARAGYSATGLPPNSINNCHCTTDTAYLYQGYSSSISNRVSKDTIKTYAAQLGEGFTNDVQRDDGTWKYNDGYPILKWQLKCNK